MMSRKIISMIVSTVLLVGENEIFATSRDFNKHIGDGAEDYENQCGDYSFGSMNKEGETILEFYISMNITNGIRLF